MTKRVFEEDVSLSINYDAEGRDLEHTVAPASRVVLDESGEKTKLEATLIRFQAGTEDELRLEQPPFKQGESITIGVTAFHHEHVLMPTGFEVTSLKHRRDELILKAVGES